jgi:hypothetical protein
MKKGDIIAVVSRVSFRLTKHSPEILVALGVVGVVASAVLACKATTKIGDILDKAKEDVDNIHHSAADASLAAYTQEDAQKDLATVYIHTGIGLAKLYAPAVILGVLSLGGVLASNNILRKRNVALAAAYAAVDKSFKEYRSRVAERFGEETDRELKYNLKARQFEETVVDEKGKEKKVTKTIQVTDSGLCSPYACFFDEYCGGWDKTPAYNMTFLRAQQAHANDQLKARGRLFLNEVYDALGAPRTKAGQVVGWVYDAENPIGDNYVDFGICDIHKEEIRDFINGYEPAILLDFNVDGNIWELM